MGNHEFDTGTAELARLIRGIATANVDALVGTALEGMVFTGTDMPYLSANLDMTKNPNLAPLCAADKIATSTVIEEGGEPIGIVGATTPTLARISSPGAVTVSLVRAGTTPTAAELDALATIIRAEVDFLPNANPTMSKVILQAHMQVLGISVPALWIASIWMT